MRSVKIYAYFAEDDIMFRSETVIKDDTVELASLNEVIDYLIQTGEPIEKENEYLVTKDGEFYFANGDYIPLLKSHEKDLIEFMDYQVLNNGMMGWISNRGYERMFDFTGLLNRRNLEIDKVVSSIFQKAVIAAMTYYQHHGSTFIPEIKEIVAEAEKSIEQCSLDYRKVAKEFMESYGLVDYISVFESLCHD